jgi:hypothetical protein
MQQWDFCGPVISCHLPYTTSRQINNNTLAPTPSRVRCTILPWVPFNLSPSFAPFAQQTAVAIWKISRLLTLLETKGKSMNEPSQTTLPVVIPWGNMHCDCKRWDLIEPITVLSEQNIIIHLSPFHLSTLNQPYFPAKESTLILCVVPPQLILWFGELGE